MLILPSKGESIRGIFEFRQIFASYYVISSISSFLATFHDFDRYRNLFQCGGGVRPVLSGLLLIYLFRVGALYLRAIFEILFQIVKLLQFEYSNFF